MRRFLVLLIAIWACSRRAPPSDFSLRIAVVGSLAPLAHDTDGTATVYAQDLVYGAIFRPEGAGFTSAVLARWERTPEKHLRARLVEGLRFSDGSVVGIEDVARSIRAAGLPVHIDGEWLDIEPGGKGLPIDTGLLMATLFKPTPAGDIGTGAFRLVQQDEHRLVVERAHPAPGRIRTVEFVSFPTGREALGRALKGEVNAVSSLDDRQAELLEGVPGLRVVRARGPHALGVFLNARRLDSRERREISMALPLEEIGLLSQGKGCDPASNPQRTGSPSGDPLDIWVMGTDAPLERAGLALRRGLGRRGGTIASVSGTRGWSSLPVRPLAVGSTLVWPPAVGALYWKTNAPLNVSGYSNPAYDAAVDAGDFERAEAELRKDPPVVLVCRRERIAAVDSRIRNATLGSWGYFDTLPDWEVSP